MSQVNNGSYDRISRVYDLLDKPSELKYHRYMRQKWISPLRNEKILELGIGTGKNLHYYHKSNEIQGIDASPQMLEEARKKINKFNIKSNVTLSLQRKLPWDLQNEKYTIGIATFVFCTMTDPSIILNELISKIIKGGKLIIFEYVRPNKNPWYAIMKTISPISKKLYGVDFNRDPTRMYLNGNFSSVKITPIISDLIEVIEIVK